MHGPEEVAFANELFDRVEGALGLPRHTVKMGIMDEERRTTVNLKDCIAAARIGWRSSTPDSSTAPATRSTPRMEAGPVMRKDDVKTPALDPAYEKATC